MFSHIQVLILACVMTVVHGETSQQCDVPQGMQSEGIQDMALAVSSAAVGKPKQHARYGCCQTDCGAAWCPTADDNSPYFEVHLQNLTTIASIKFQHPTSATPPCSDFATEYMKTFRLLYKPAIGSDEFLEFNHDIQSIYNKSLTFWVGFKPYIVTKAIRIEPQTYEKTPCFKFEILGCEPTGLCQKDFCKHGGTCVGDNLCQCKGAYFGEQCQYTEIEIHTFITKFIFLRIENNILLTTSFNMSVSGSVAVETLGTQSLIRLGKGGTATVAAGSGQPSSCLHSLDTCLSGFTYSLTLNIENVTSRKLYLISNGVDETSHNGIWLYYEGATLSCHVATSSHVWGIDVKTSLLLSVWYTIEISWNRILGLRLLLNSKTIGSITQSVERQPGNFPTEALSIGSTLNTGVIMRIYQLQLAPLVKSELIRAQITNGPLPAATAPGTATVTTPSSPTQTVCETPLGMSDKTIADAQLTVSTIDPHHSKEQLRYGCCTEEHIGAWCSADTDTHPWVQVKLKTPMAISKIVFQHPAERNRTVTPSRYVRDVQMFYNNLFTDTSRLELYSQHIPVTHNATVAHSVKLHPAVVTDTIHLIITHFVGRPCMRLELIGCNPEVLCQLDFCQNGGSCIGEDVCKCKDNYYGIRCQLTKSEIANYNYRVIEQIGNIITTTHLNMTIHNMVEVKTYQTETYLVFSSHGYVEIPQTDPCIQHLDQCNSGFTYSFNINFRNVSNEMPILATGDGDSGVFMRYTNSSFICTVGTSKGMWTINVAHHLILETWYQIDLSWSKFHGLHLYVDGADIGGTVAAVVKQHNFAKHHLWIGNGYTTMPKVETFTYWMKQIHIFFNVRQDLTRAGLLENKDPSTTPIISRATTAKPEPSSCNSSSTDITFTSINGTDLLTSLTTMKVHGDANLEQSKIGTVLVLDGPGQYIDMQNTGVPCLDDLTTCFTNFNFRLTFQFIKIDLQPNYILSSGGELVNSNGVALFYWNGKLNFWVKNGKSVAKSIFSVNMTNSTWYTLDASWDKTTEETSVHLNGRALQNSPLPKTDAPQTTMTHFLLIGKSWGKNHTSHIKLLLFRMRTDSLKEMAEHNCSEELSIPDVAPTPAPVETCNGTPVSSTKTTIDMSFLSVTGSRLTTKDMVITVHGSPSIIQQNDTISLDISQPGQYVEIETRCLPCFSDLEHCTTGFTVQLVATFTQLVTTERMYIVYTGQDKPGYTGVNLFYERGHLKGVVASGQHKWPINIPYKLEIGIPYIFQISWSQTSGYQLYVNEYTTQPTQSLPVFVDATKIPSSFLIGKEVNSNKTTSMVITDFKLFMATRTELVNLGILQPALTTISTTTLVPPTSPPLPEFIWRFENLTTNYLNSSYLKVIIHGGPHGTSSGLVFTADRDYLEIQNLGKSCLTDITKCKHGLTISVEMVFTKLNENTVVFTTGGEAPDLPGISLLYRYGQFHVIVSSSVKAWFVSIPRDHIELSTPQVIYIYFKETLKVYINRKLVASTMEHVTHLDTSREMKSVFYFGKSFTTLTPGHHLQCVLKAIHIWYQGIDIVSQLTSTPAVTSSSDLCPVGCISLASKSMPETTQRMTFPPTNPPTTTAPTTHAVTTTTTQARTTQDIGVPPFNVDLTVIPIVDMTGTYLACRLSTYTTLNVFIQFQWIIDGVPQALKEVQTPVTEGRLYITEISNVRDNLYDKEIFCKAKAKFTAGWQWTEYLTFKTPFIPSITSLTSTTAHLTLTEGQQVRQIEVKSNCPPQLFCTLTDKGNCKVEVVASLVKHPLDHLCTRDIVLPQIVIQSFGNTDVCGKGLNSSNWKNTIQIPMKATIDGLYDHDQTRDIMVKLKTTGALKESMYKTIATYKVKAKDFDKSAQCASLNDPHITTFDGLHYNNFQRGEFILYKHKTLPYEVRTSYQVCSSRNSRGPTCNCAVAIKSGDDVITFTGCHGQAHRTYYSRFFHHTPSITMEMYKNGDLTPGTTVRRIGCGQKYEVHLPTGTIVTVQSSYLSFINVWVRPSSLDFRQSEGLCGSYTGSKHDDLYGADHRTYTVKQTPDEFSKTWLVSERNTMFHGVAAQKTTSETYCSCVEGRQLYCAPHLDIFRCTSMSSRDDITATLVRQAKLPNAAFRRFKREAPMQTEPLGEDTAENTYTEQSAHTFCEDYINNQTATKACVDYVSVTDDLIKECTQDLVATGETEWAQSHLDDIVTRCISEAERNVSMWNGADNSTIWENIPKDIMTNLCPTECIHGNCSEGACVCEDGYTGLNCSLSKDVQPAILPVNEDSGGCNINHMDCSQITIMGLNFVDSYTLSCFYQPIKVTSHVVVTDQWIPAPATFLSMYQVVCTLPRPPHSARVAVSNNGQRRSDQTYLHVVYDDCHTCDINEEGTEASCSRKAATCLISGACYREGDRMPGDKCQLCDPHTNEANWTRGTDPICTATKLTASGQTGNGLSTPTIALAVVVAVCAVVIVAGVVIICRKSAPARRKKFMEEGHYDSPQSRLSAMPRPNLRDISFSNLAYDGNASSLTTPEMTETLGGVGQ
ncbi:uncharacterized protein [Haliotis cracherodii]|uniref:uncharacterized protein n=1 Tax=Haliotis cracherodii TaxID=6455 RepID=UPI0039EC8A6E